MLLSSNLLAYTYAEAILPDETAIVDETNKPREIARPNETIKPKPIEDYSIDWLNTASISVGLSIVNGRALMSGSVIGNTGTQSITVNATLERINPNGTYTHIGSFSDMRANGNKWSWERPHYVTRGQYYRLTLKATVVRNGVSEIAAHSKIAWAN